jgi:predicted dehydrogenase
VLLARSKSPQAGRDACATGSAKWGRHPCLPVFATITTGCYTADMSNPCENDSTRRHFMKTTSLAAGMTALSASRVLGANDRVRLGLIGCGRQGRGVAATILGQGGVQYVAACDVFEPNLERGKKLRTGGALALQEHTAEPMKDFRHLLDRKDIDAVVVGSPDHWHGLHTIMACQAGKDVYVEKPLCRVVEEGRAMVQAGRKYNRVVQMGTQQRSGTHFQKAVQLLWDGQIGKITFVRTWNYGNQFPQGFGNPADSDPPAGLDWDAWLGPAPMRPFNASRFGVKEGIFSTFRFFWDYAGGMMTDWGVHLLDIVQWGLRADAPLTVYAAGGKYLLKDNRDTPDTLQVTYEYPGDPHCIVTYENRECNANSMYEHGYGIEFHGTEGTLFLDRGGFKIYPEKRKIGDNSYDLTVAAEMKDLRDQGSGHAANFLECLRTRKPPISDVEVGHRSTTCCLLANVSYRTSEKLVWDAKAEKLVGASAKAEQLLKPNYRSPFELKV